MKKIFAILFLLLLIILVSPVLYLKYFTFIVVPSHCGIIVEKGNIYKKTLTPGSYSINPFTQKVEFIDVEKLRKWQGRIGSNKSYTIQILWNVKDPVTFYKENKKHNILSETEDRFNTLLIPIKEVLHENDIITIIEGRSHDLNFSNDTLREIRNLYQAEIDRYGLLIYRIDIFKQALPITLREKGVKKKGSSPLLTPFALL